MKYKALRGYLRSKQLKQDYFLQNGLVVIDAKSYFSEHTYGKSGCQYIFGSECDRYANYLKNSLNYFILSNITCYVIFNGGMRADVQTRRAIHERIIKDRDAINPKTYKNGTFDPIFAKDVQKEVLDELGIKYFCCEYDIKASIVSVAKEFNCPVITNNIEYCLYGVSCITTNSLVLEKRNKRIVCCVYDHELCSRVIGIRGYLIPIFMTLVDEDGYHFNSLPEIIPSRKHNRIPLVIRWMRRQNKENAINTIAIISRNLKDDDKSRTFIDSCEEKINRHPRYHMASKYFHELEPYQLMKNDETWFSKGVSNGRIAVPYVNLKNMGAFSGCWQIYETNKDDAILAAIDIVSFVHCLLTQSQQSNLTIIGRKQDVCYVSEIEKKWDSQIPLECIFVNGQKSKKGTGVDKKSKFKFVNPFWFFLRESLPGFDFNMLKTLPEDSRLLVVTLVYYIRKTNKDFVCAAYSVLLCYVMLGPVSAKVGVIKRSNFLVSHSTQEHDSCAQGLTHQACVSASNALMEMFYVEDIKGKFDRNILHAFAEFQHCLQHMNYLNKLCGESIKCTLYHKTYNGTFVINVFHLIKDKEDPVAHLKSLLKESSVFLLFNNILDIFDKCLLSVHDE